MMTIVRSAALAALLLVSLPTLALAHNGLVHTGCPAAQVFTAGALSISGAYSRAMLPGAQTGGGYLTISNAGPRADRLLGATSKAAGMVELHQMSVVDGVMNMGAVEGGLEIPAGGSVTLAPGGYHLMMMAIAVPFKEGECLELTLDFEVAGDVPVVLNIGGVAQDEPVMDHGAHNMGSMEMSAAN